LADSDWVTVEVNLDPILAPVDPILTVVDNVLGFLITLLNITQTILNVLKVFLVGFLDPLRSLVELIIAEIRALIRDLRQLGLYLTGDWDLLSSDDKFSNVLGGYQAYERRMIGRLQDRTDPYRPDFSSSSVTLGAFFYTSSGDINELIRVINAFLRFFGQPQLAAGGSPYGRPTAPEMKYGVQGQSQGAFKDLGTLSQGQGTVPDQVSVTWQMPASAGGIGQLFNPAPKGFLIHVSTIPDGLNVLGLTPKDDKSGRVADLPRVQAAAVDPTTNGPLKLYGGIADIGVPGSDFATVEKDNPRAPILVLQKDQNTPLIFPSLLSQRQGPPLLANTYYVKTSFLTRMGPGTSYTATFSQSELPRGASFQAGANGFAILDGTFRPNTYWFRIRALTEDYVDALGLDDASLRNPVSVYENSQVRLFRFSQEGLRASRNGVLVPEPPGLNGGTTLTPNSFTAASSPGVADFPSADQISYIRAVQAAVALAILCRADLTEAVTTSEYVVFSYNTYNPGYGLLGLEGAGRDLLARYGVDQTFFQGNRPSAFRRKMRWVLNQIAADLQTRGAPPETVARAVLLDASPLLSFKWSQMDAAYPALTILQSINAAPVVTVGANQAIPADETQGLGGNPYCRSIHKKVLRSIYSSPKSLNEVPDRPPSLQLTEGAETRRAKGDFTWVSGEGSADFSPIIFNDSIPLPEGGTGTQVEYIRNAFLARMGFWNVLESATAVLQLAAAPISRPVGDTKWIAIRLMPQVLIPLDDLLERLDRFMQGILDGLVGIIDKIVAYIEAIQARIYQLQALLEQIRALLRSLTFFALPSVSGLVIVESGTDGITAGLVTAGNKPQDAYSSYGAGIAIVAGGLPSVLLELLGLILGGFSGGEEG